jgi:hypothetical protein
MEWPDAAVFSWVLYVLWLFCVGVESEVWHSLDGGHDDALHP